MSSIKDNDTALFAMYLLFSCKICEAAIDAYAYNNRPVDSCIDSAMIGIKWFIEDLRDISEYSGFDLGENFSDESLDELKKEFPEKIKETFYGSYALGQRKGFLSLIFG